VCSYRRASGDRGDAGRQRGVVTWTQLLAAGIGGRAIERRLRAGHLHVVRVTWRQLVNEPEGVGARLAMALAVRGFGRVAGKLAE
jgi:hypothetical protein